MDNAKTISVLLIIFAGYGLYLESQDKLVAILKVIFTNEAVNITLPPANTSTEKLINNAIANIWGTNAIAPFMIAIVIYIIVTGFLDDKSTIFLSLILVMGSAIVNQRINGTHTFLNTLEGN